MDGVFEGLVSLGVWHCCDVLLFVLNAGPSELVAVTIMTVALLSFGNLTNLERQLTALFVATDINFNTIFLVASSNPHLLTLLFAFFPFRNLANSLWLLWIKISDPWR